MKNISFLVDETGIRLAPFYDIVSTVVYTTPEHDRHGPWWPEVKLSMPIGEAESFSSITRVDLLSLARDIGLPVRPAERLLNQMVTSIVPAGEALASRMGAHAGERRLLNAIVHLPVKEMAKRLAKPAA